ncbi:hypothetical protein DL95DRAFT_404810 [Leptodontidium sp. 2 PMI_412]|nr:hypothetical protein DL95DRAFT_404810 [Leptodontidium sp. 2 PMI_412]
MAAAEVCACWCLCLLLACSTWKTASCRALTKVQQHHRHIKLVSHETATLTTLPCHAEPSRHVANATTVWLKLGSSKLHELLSTDIGQPLHSMDRPLVPCRCSIVPLAVPTVAARSRSGLPFRSSVARKGHVKPAVLIDRSELFDRKCSACLPKYQLLNTKEHATASTPPPIVVCLVKISNHPLLEVWPHRVTKAEALESHEQMMEGDGPIVEDVRSVPFLP